MRPQRQLGFLAALAAVTGESIALGIFLTPAGMAKSLGSPLLLGSVWVAMGIMAMLGALCFGELAARFPASGGEFVYLTEGWGPRLAYLYGWMCAVVMLPGVAAAMAFGSAAYLAQLLPLPPLAVRTEPYAVLLAFCVLNVLGTRLSGSVMTVLNALKLLVLAGIVLLALLSAHAHAANLTPFVARRPGSPALAPAIVGALVGAFYSFGGWWDATKIAGEVRNARRNMPLALACGVALVGALYLLVSFTFLLVVPIQSVTSNTAFVAQFGAALFGPWGARILSVCVLLCVFGGAAALTMAAPRVTYAMAADGAFPAIFAKLHPRRGTPVAAVLLQTALAMAILLFGAFDRLLTFISFPAIVFLALTAAALFRLQPPVRTWWYPWAPIVFLAICAVVDVLVLLHDPLPVVIGAAIVLVGLPLRRVMAAKPQNN